ncbi:MAG: TonB-dependent receptor domain-containing protein [Pseudohaliea sp.]
MLRKHRLTTAVSAALGLGAAAVLPGQALAQEEALVEEVVVTGSRIQKANLISSSPVTQVDSEQFKFQGVTRVEDLLNDLPSVYPGNNANQANGATGTATINLRNLGANRTLVLMNGRRLPIGSPLAGGQGADINNIPAALIERVEVLTGGASSTYGSDAVAGVVNFIMVDDFEGVQLDVQYSGYQHENDNGTAQRINREAGFTAPDGSVSDGDIQDLSLIIGANLDGGRGNVTGYVTYRNIEEVRWGDRDYSNCAIRGDENDPSCGGSSTVPWGRFTDFGLLSDTGPGSFDYSVEGNEFRPFGPLYNFGPDNFLQRPDERYTAGMFGRYQINEHAEVFTEFNFMDNRSNAQIAPSGAFFVTSELSCGNPFLSEQQFDLICGQYGLTENEFQDVFVGRRNVEGGFRNNDIRHTTFRGVFGMRGEINDAWSYEASYQYAETSLEQTYNNDLSITRIGRALDAVTDPDTGETVCRSALNGVDPGCVPWNIFEEGAVTSDMTDYLVAPLFARGTTDQTVMLGYVTGNLGEYGIALPTAESGVSVVLGYEYREENLNYEPDTGFTSGDGAGQGGPTLGVNGGFDVQEFFTEINIPIVEGKQFAEEVSLDLGYRYSDYSTNIDTDTYKVAMAWSVTPDIRLRASYNRAVRAANIRELFRPQSIGLFDMAEDKCAGPNPTASFEQCARTGVTQAQYGNIADSPAGQYNEITGGNPDLEPEESDTYSYGVIWSPSFVEDLTITVDYFDIEVKDAIAGIASPTTIDRCLETGQAQFCDRVNRGPGTGTLWIGQDNVLSVDENIGFFATEGFDYTIDYTLGVGDMGSVNFANIGTYLTTWDQQEFVGEPIEDCVGIWSDSCGAPTFEWQNNLRVSWMTPWSVTLSAQWRYMSEIDDAADNWNLPEQNYLDLSGIWDITDMITLRAGIQNVTDEDPPFTDAGPSIFGNGNTFAGVYDALGRYYFIGGTFQF